MKKIKATDIPTTPFAFVWFSIKEYRKLFLIALTFVFLQQLFNGLYSVVFKGFVDNASLYTDGGNVSLKIVFLWILAIPIIRILSVSSVRASSFVFNFLTVHIRTKVSKIIFEYLSLHSLSYFNDRFSGALSNRVNTLSSNVSRISFQGTSLLMGFILNFIVSSTIIFSANKTLFLAFIGGSVILVPINYLVTKRQLVLSSELAKILAKLRGDIIDVITNIASVQAYARRAFEIDRLDKAIVEYREADVKSDNFREWVLLTNNLFAGLFSGGIILWAFSFWANGDMTTGSLVMIITLTGGFINSLTNIGQNLNNFMEVYGEMGEGLSEIIVPHTITDNLLAKKLDIKDGSVRFDEVSFSYSDENEKIFEELKFEVKGGEKVGIVGTSGAGKTTLIKLLLRQYDVLDGGIKIDDQDIRDITIDSLRENISIVPQEPMLFHRTIRENIMYGNLDATEEEMMEVAKKSQIHDFIETLPLKYDTLVGERGVKLSVGQRQRIATARAFLKNAPILILDEATSALDSESEVAVQKALELLMEGKTVFAIAHRLSTLRDMDRILVFKDGKIIEDGTHRSLLRNKEGAYSSFWNHQAGGFIVETKNS